MLRAGPYELFRPGEMVRGRRKYKSDHYCPFWSLWKGRLLVVMSALCIVVNVRAEGFYGNTGIVRSYPILAGGCQLFAVSPYNKVPFDLSKAGSVATTIIKINRDDRYKFSLAFTFERDGKKYLSDIPVYMELHKFLRGYPKSPPGAIIPIKLTINKLDDESKNPQHEKVYETKGLHRSNDNAVFREITIVHLQPGRYSVRLESFKDFPDLPKATVTLEVLRFFAP